MGSAFDVAETLIGKAIFQHVAYDAGATLAICWATAADETGFTEVANANGYARTGVTANATNFPEDGTIKGQFSNGTAIITANASGAGWTATHVVITDSATYGAGNRIAWNALDAPITVPSGSNAKFDIGQMIWQVD